MKSKENMENATRTQSVKSSGKAPSSGRVLQRAEGGATQRGTVNKNVKNLRGK